MWDMLPCAVLTWVEHWILKHWGVISSKNEGVGTLSATWP